MAYFGGKFTVPEGIGPGARINIVSQKSATSVLSPRGIVALPLELNWGAEDDLIYYKAKDYTRDALYNFGYDVKSPELKAIDEAFCGATEILVCRLNSGGEKAKCDLAEAKWSGIRGNDLAISVEADPDSDYVDNELADVNVTFTAENDVVTAKYNKVPDGYKIVGTVLMDGQPVPSTQAIVNVLENELSITFTTSAKPGAYQIKAGLQYGPVKYTMNTGEINVAIDPATSRYVTLTKGTEKPGTAVETADATFDFKNNKITVTFSNVPEGYKPSVRIKGQVGILAFIPGRMEDMSLSNGNKHIVTYSPGAPVNGEMTIEAVLTKDNVTVIKSHTYTAAVEGEDKPETAVATYQSATPETYESQKPGRYIVKTFLEGTEVNKQKVRGMYQIKNTDFVNFNTERELELTAGMPLTGGTNGDVTAERWAEILNQLETQSFHVLGWPTTDEQLLQMAINYTRKMRDEMGIKFQTVMPKPAEPANYEGIIQIENRVKDADVANPDAALVYWVAGKQAGCKIQDSVANSVYDGSYDVDVDYSQRDLENLIEDGLFAFHLARGKVNDDGTTPQVVKVLLDINSLTEPGDDQGESWKNNQTVRVMDQCANDIAAIFNNDYFGKIPNTQTGREQFRNSIIEHHTQLETITAIENFDPDDVVVEAGGNDKVTILATDAIQPINAMEKLFMTIAVI